MSSQGFRLVELRVTGNEKTDAIISFRSGLNVISGSSDTGKSYIYECIKFMFGSSKRPHELEKEDIGYESVYLQIKTFEDIDFTLKRDFTSSHFHVWNLPYPEAINSSDYNTYYRTKKDEPEKLISTFFLKMMKGYGLKIKANQRGRLENLTMGSIRPYFEVNETKIQADYSFLSQDGKAVTAKDRSSFRSFLTTLDDKECKEVESKEVQSAKISGKLEYLDEQEKRINERITAFEKKLENIDREDIKNKIDSLTEILSVDSKMINDATDKRFSLWNQLKEDESKLIYNQELLERFHLLKKTYDDDLSRLEFIEEGQHYLTQLEDVNCPTCHQPMPETPIIENEIAGLEAEKNSIEKKASDLSATIESVRSDSKVLQDRIDITKSDIRKIDIKLNTDLKTKINLSKEELLKFEQISREFVFLDREIEDLAEVKARKSYYSEVKVTGKQKTDYTNELDGSIYSEISSEIYKLLESWSYNDIGDVKFDSDIDDWRINAKSRLSHGKGHRALLYSAYLIGLLNYCMADERKTLHPNLVILDSPLTAYKDQENSSIPENDQISHDTEMEFFSNLSSFKDSQIIIFDNKEPTGIPEDQVNHIHFTKNHAEGRYGFFPVPK